MSLVVRTDRFAAERTTSPFTGAFGASEGPIEVGSSAE